MQQARAADPEKYRQIKRASMDRTREATNQRQRERYYKNREAVKEERRQYRANNKELICEQRRRNYLLNTEKKAKQDKAYRLRNIEKVRERLKSYRERNRAEVRLRNRSRKLLLKYSKGDFSHQDWELCLSYWRYRCAVCGRAASSVRRLAMDHWLPLSKGGLTCRSNIVPLCHGSQGCNNQKLDKDPAVWLSAQFGEDFARQILESIRAYFNSLSG
jgi:hypothetical protein